MKTKYIQKFKHLILIVIVFPLIEGCADFFFPCDPGRNATYDDIQTNITMNVEPLGETNVVIFYKNHRDSIIDVESFIDSTLIGNQIRVEYTVQGETWDDNKVAYPYYLKLQDTLHLWVSPYSDSSEFNKPRSLRFEACSFADSYVEIVSARFNHPPNRIFTFKEKDFE